MKKLLLSLLAVAAVSSFAEGFYVGVSGNYADTFGSSGSINDSTDGAGFGLQAGYQVNKYVAAQLGYDWLGSNGKTFKKANGNTLSVPFSLQQNIYSATAKLGYPMLNDKLTPFVQLGLASVFTSEGNGTNFTGYRQYMGLYEGAGVAYNVTKAIAVDAHVNYIVSATDSYTGSTPLMVGAGLTYAF